MSYCLNPHCPHPKGDLTEDICNRCGASFIVKERYRSLNLLGKSQLALTLEVADLHRDNCSKVLKILLINYSKAVELFQQEAMVLQQMNHPGIPQVEPAGYFTVRANWSDEPLHCLVMEKIAGINLKQWLAKANRQPLSNQQAINWLKQLLKILAQLHKEQYFHRDIKPANIILQPNNQLALVDFGAARKVTTTYLGKIAINKGITSIGTPGYMPPEQIDGSALPQSDFFALGRTLVHLLTGKHPQELPKNSDTGQLIWRESAPYVSESLADLLDSLMNHLPGKRPHNTATILTFLATVQKFPKRYKWRKVPQQVWLGSILLPLSIFGLFTISNGINRRVISELSTWARTEAPPNSHHYVEDRQGTKYGAAIVPVDQWDNHYNDMGLGKDVEIRACAKPKTGAIKCTNFVKL